MASRRRNSDQSHHRSDKTPIGYDYVHSLIDDHSRFAYSEILADEKGTTCRAFLLRAAAYFAAHGITQIQRVMTDNAWAYRYALGRAIDHIGAKQVFTRPYSPWQNGKVERLNRTLQREWAYRQVCSAPTSSAPQRLHPGSSTTTIDAGTPLWVADL